MDISVADQCLPDFRREGMTLDHTFMLMPAAERLRVVVRDVRTGAIAVSRQPLQAIGR